MRVIILHKLLCISLLYVSLLHLTCPQAIAASPVGTLDGVSPTGYINGWVYDPDSPNDSIDVHIYIDGPAEKTQNGGRFVALVKANLDSPDVNTAFNISGKHRFSYQLSGYDLIGYRGIYPHAIDPQGGLNPLLNNSPLYLGNPAPANNQLTRSVLGHPMTLKTFASLGGAIGSLTWNGQEFIDMHDHGRELQSASTFGYGCCYNPTEAGGDFDGLGTEPSSSQLLWYSPTTKGFEALTRMAFWYAPGKSADAWCYNSTPIVANTSKISNDLLYRNIEVGVDEFDNVIKYQTRFYIAPNQSANILDGYDRHQVGELEIVTGYMPPVFDKFEYYYPHFQELYPASDDYSNGFPLVFSTQDGSFAMAAYNPLITSHTCPLARYGAQKWPDLVKWTAVYTLSPIPADWGQTFTTYLIIGTRDQVKETLATIVERYPQTGTCTNSNSYDINCDDTLSILDWNKIIQSITDPINAYIRADTTNNGLIDWLDLLRWVQFFQ